MNIKFFFNKFEDIILILIGFILPWSILFATPQLHIGYWGQVEGMIVFNHFISAILALLLIKKGSDKEIRQYFTNPIVLLPSLLALYSLCSALFQRLPILSLYGSPQLGQGAFGYFSLSLLTVLYIYIIKKYKISFLLLINFFILIIVITVGSFYPAITGIVISFFGFNDWLALYLSAFTIYSIYYIESKNIRINKSLLAFIIFLLLGPLFWKIDNNSAIALWVLISLGWLFWILNNYFDTRVRIINNIIYNPYIFTFIPIALTVLMLLSSFIFWDGKTDQTNELTTVEIFSESDPDEIIDIKIIGHLGTFIARGSIVRVLFEHLGSLKAIVFGYGWGSTSELLLKSFTPEVFYQINTGNRVHFHTHNEIFEHIFSIGFVGVFLYLMYIYCIFKYAFKVSLGLAIAWLLYFSIGVFWFQWISFIVIQAMLAATLILNDNKKINNFFSIKVSFLFNNSLFYYFYTFLISVFLFYGAYIGYYTAYNHMLSFRSDELITLSKEARLTGNCSETIYDYGKGGFQFSQKLNGYSNYYKDQVILYGRLNDSDIEVMEWLLCASHEVISMKKASLELINVHINTLSMLSILPGKLGEESRIRMNKYINLWEDKLKLLISYAPKRQDQATPLISYYIRNDNIEGIKNICSYLDKNSEYQGFCDLAMGYVYLKEENFEEGMILIERAYDKGVLDSEYIDEDTSNTLKNLIIEYKN